MKSRSFGLAVLGLFISPLASARPCSLALAADYGRAVIAVERESSGHQDGQLTWQRGKSNVLDMAF